VVPGCDDPQPAPNQARWSPEAVAPGIHIRRGVDEDGQRRQTADAIANIGFVVGRNAVAVFEPGR